MFHGVQRIDSDDAQPLGPYAGVAGVTFGRAPDSSRPTEKVAQQIPDTHLILEKVALVHNNLRIRLADLGQVETALAVLQVWRDVRMRLVKRFPGEREHQDSLILAETTK